MNAKLHKAIKRINEGRSRDGDDARVSRHFDALQSRTHAKSPAERVRKQYKHELRDEHGAYTLVGRNPITKHAPDNVKPHMPRRVWLAGISAQRGF